MCKIQSEQSEEKEAFFPMVCENTNCYTLSEK